MALAKWCYCTEDHQSIYCTYHHKSNVNPHYNYLGSDAEVPPAELLPVTKPKVIDWLKLNRECS